MVTDAIIIGWASVNSRTMSLFQTPHGRARRAHSYSCHLVDFARRSYLSVCTVEESFTRPSARGWSSAYRTPARAILSCAAFTSGRSVIWAEVSGFRCNRPCFSFAIDAVAHVNFCHELNTCSEIRPLQHGRLPRADMHFSAADSQQTVDHSAFIADQHPIRVR